MLSLEESAIKLFLDEWTVSGFEAWVYENNEIEQTLDAKNYLDLIGIDFRGRHALYEARKILKPYTNIAEARRRQLFRLLENIKNRGQGAHVDIGASYDLYCKGWYFLGDLGLPSGLPLQSVPPNLQEDYIDQFYPDIVFIVDKILNWLNTEKIIILSDNEGEPNVLQYDDRRPFSWRLKNIYIPRLKSKIRRLMHI